MKKLLVVLLVLLLTTGSALASGGKEKIWVNPGTVATADQLTHTGASFFHGISVATDGTNSVTFDVYDGTDNTGTKIHPSWVVTTSSVSRLQTLSIWPPVRCATGIYVDITTSGTVEFTVYFTKE